MMHQENTKKDDIVIRLYQTPDKSGIDYNVSEFLQLHNPDGSSTNLVASIDKFIHLLDAKVHIKLTDPRYAHIYQGIETVVKHNLEELTKLDPFFADVKLQQVGSTMSDTKVGLPHEADYVLVLPKDKLLATGEACEITTLFQLVQKVIKKLTNQITTLTKKLPHWVILGVKHHNRIGGFCLVMKCYANPNERISEEVGVLVDLVPAYIMETTPESFNEKSKAFLPHSLEEYAQQGQLYGLVMDPLNDTGLVENSVIKQLQENQKRSFRVVKFLISNLLVSSDARISKIEGLGEATRLRLYGSQPLICSYELRRIFLNLLIHVHGTEAEEQLKGGLLVMCLLDMLQQCRVYGRVSGEAVPLMTFKANGNLKLC